MPFFRKIWQIIFLGKGGGGKNWTEVCYLITVPYHTYIVRIIWGAKIQSGLIFLNKNIYPSRWTSTGYYLCPPQIPLQLLPPPSPPACAAGKWWLFPYINPIIKYTSTYIWFLCNFSSFAEPSLFQFKYIFFCKNSI